MLREVFREQGRPSAPKIGVMITNEPTSTRRLTMAETDLAKTEGVKLYTIGVGNLVDRGELLNTATSEKHVLLTPNANSLESILPNLRHLICDGKTSSKIRQISLFRSNSNVFILYLLYDFY